MCQLIIKELAKAKGVSMRDLATAAGYHQTTSLYQSLQHNRLTTKQLESIAHLLGVSVPQLFENVTQCPHCGHKFTLTIKAE